MGSSCSRSAAPVADAPVADAPVKVATSSTLVKATGKCFRALDAGVDSEVTYFKSHELANVLKGSSDARLEFCTLGHLVSLVDRLDRAVNFFQVLTICSIVELLTLDPECRLPISESRFLEKVRPFLRFGAEWLDRNRNLNQLLFAVAKVVSESRQSVQVLVDDPQIARALLRPMYTSSRPCVAVNVWWMLFYMADHSVDGARCVFPEGREGDMLDTCTDFMSRLVSEPDIPYVVIKVLLASARRIPAVQHAVDARAAVIRPLLEWHVKSSNVNLRLEAIRALKELGLEPDGSVTKTWALPLPYHDRLTLENLVDGLRTVPDTSPTFSLVIDELDSFLTTKTDERRVSPESLRDANLFEALAGLCPTNSRVLALSERLLKQYELDLDPIDRVMCDTGIVRLILQRRLIDPAEQGQAPSADAKEWISWLQTWLFHSPSSAEVLRANDSELAKLIEVVVRWCLPQRDFDDAFPVIPLVRTVHRVLPDDTRTLYEDVTRSLVGRCFAGKAHSQHDSDARPVAVLTDNLAVIFQTCDTMCASDIPLAPEEYDALETFASSVPSEGHSLESRTGHCVRGLLRRHAERGLRVV